MNTFSRELISSPFLYLIVPGAGSIFAASEIWIHNTRSIPPDRESGKLTTAQFFEASMLASRGTWTCNPCCSLRWPSVSTGPSILRVHRNYIVVYKVGSYGIESNDIDTKSLSYLRMGCGLSSWSPVFRRSNEDSRSPKDNVVKTTFYKIKYWKIKNPTAKR